MKEFADELESAENFRETLHNLIVSNLRKHNRIIFNGNGYAPEWVEEAARRGLPNYVSTVDALPHMLDEKNIKLFTTFGVFTEAEIRSRYEIKLENYAKVLNIEAETCLMMAEKEILPACMKFAGATAKAVNAMKTAGVEPYAEAHVLADVAERNAKLYKALEGLRGAVKATCHGDALECAKYEHNVIIPAMAAVREQADELETLVGKEYWPFRRMTTCSSTCNNLLHKDVQVERFFRSPARFLYSSTVATHPTKGLGGAWKWIFPASWHQLTAKSSAYGF